jgi:hypothetical protein
MHYVSRSHNRDNPAFDMGIFLPQKKRKCRFHVLMAHPAEITKKPCCCGHGLAAHRFLRRGLALSSKKLHPCIHPGCECKDYKPEKPK